MRMARPGRRAVAVSARPAAGKTRMHNVLAGNPGPPPSPATIIATVAFLALGAGIVLGGAARAGSRWRASQADARREALAQDVTASWSVWMTRPDSSRTLRGRDLDLARLSLRGGFIEAAHVLSVVRFLNRGEFYFPARETQIQIRRAPGVFRREELIISGPSGGQPAHISISATNSAALHEIWNALIAAGATPD